MILGSLKKFKKRSPEELKPRSKDTRRTSGNTTRNDPFPPFLILEAQTQVRVAPTIPVPADSFKGSFGDTIDIDDRGSRDGLRNHERQARIEIERQLASIQESQRQDREDFKKLKEFMTSQFEHRS
ncbi:hypothetical protein Tco_0401009 [Tanacetum coccineum]